MTKPMRVQITGIYDIQRFADKNMFIEIVGIRQSKIETDHAQRNPGDNDHQANDKPPYLFRLVFSSGIDNRAHWINADQE